MQKVNIMLYVQIHILENQKASQLLACKAERRQWQQAGR